MTSVNAADETRQREYVWKPGLNKQCARCKAAHRACDRLQYCYRCRDSGVEPTECYYTRRQARGRKATDRNATAASVREYVWREGLYTSCTECQAQHRKCDSAQHCTSCRTGQVPAKDCYYRRRQPTQHSQSGASHLEADQSEVLTAEQVVITLGSVSHAEEDAPGRSGSEEVGVAAEAGPSWETTGKGAGRPSQSSQEGFLPGEIETGSQAAEEITTASALVDLSAFTLSLIHI